MKQYIINENDANIRLDKFLKKLFINAPISLIYKLNRKNKIKVNNKKMNNEYKTQVGDIINFFLSDKEFYDLTFKSQLQTTQNIDIKTNFNIKNIVYEDVDILVINKDAGINVHPGDNKTKESNIIFQIHDYLGPNNQIFKPSLVHRIDRDTSGILVIAKKRNILTKLVSDFKNHKKIRKIYYSIVLGRPKNISQTINFKLKRIKNAKNENKVKISSDGQNAVTKYRLLKSYSLKINTSIIKISELEIEIFTGRMHQIRVHLASIGHPIIGDNKYGNKQINSYFKRNFGLTRQTLHAKKIEFFHYGKNKMISFEAKIKKDLTDFISKIRAIGKKQ